MEFATELSKIIRQASISQNQLAKAISMSSTHVSNLMNSKRRPSKDTLETIITKLKLPDASAKRLRRAVAKDMGLLH